MSKVYQRHDKFFRSAMSRKQVAKEFFQQHLPQSVLKDIKLETLALCKESFIDKNLTKSSSDLLYSVNIMDQIGYLYLLVEHQSEPDELMPFRILKYIIMIMELHMQKTGNKRLPVVYPLILYNGKKKYRFSTDIFSLFYEQENLARALMFKPIKLINVNEITDSELKQYPYVGIMQYFMKHIYKRDLIQYLRDCLSELEFLLKAGEMDFLESLLTYVMTAIDMDETEFFQTVKHEISSQLGDKIMSLADRLETKGFNRGKSIGVIEGRAEGKAEGKTEVQLAIARKLLKKGVNIEMIISVTELTLEQIKQLEQEINIV